MHRQREVAQLNPKVRREFLGQVSDSGRLRLLSQLVRFGDRNSVLELLDAVGEEGLSRLAQESLGTIDVSELKHDVGGPKATGRASEFANRSGLKVEESLASEVVWEFGSAGIAGNRGERTGVLEGIVAEHGEALGILDLGDEGVLGGLHGGVVHRLEPAKDGE